MSDENEIVRYANEIVSNRLIRNMDTLNKLKKVEVNAGLNNELDLSCLPDTIEVMTIHSPFAKSVTGMNHLVNLRELHIESLSAEELYLSNNLKSLKVVTIDCSTKLKLDMKTDIMLDRLVSIDPIDYTDDNWYQVLSRVRNIEMTIGFDSDEPLDLSEAEKITLNINSETPVLVDCPKAKDITIEGCHLLYLDYLRYDPKVLKKLDICADNVEGIIRPSRMLKELLVNPNNSSSLVIDPSSFPNLRTLNVHNIVGIGDDVSLSKCEEFWVGDLDISPTTIELPSATDVKLEGLTVESLRVDSNKLKNLVAIGSTLDYVSAEKSDVLLKVRLLGSIGLIELPTEMMDLDTLHITNTSNSPLTLTGATKIGDNIKHVMLTSQGDINYTLPKIKQLHTLLILCPNYEVVNQSNANVNIEIVDAK